MKYGRHFQSDLVCFSEIKFHSGTVNLFKKTLSVEKWDAVVVVSCIAISGAGQRLI